MRFSYGTRFGHQLGILLTSRLVVLTPLRSTLITKDGALVAVPDPSQGRGRIGGDPMTHRIGQPERCLGLGGGRPGTIFIKAELDKQE